MTSRPDALGATPAAGDVEHLLRRLSECAMTVDVLSRMTEASSEDEVVERLFDLLTDLCGPALIAFVPCRDGLPGEPILRPASEVLPARDLASINGLVGEHGWTDSGDGFVLRVQAAGTTLGVLLVGGLALPSRRDEYLNLAVSAAGIVGLAVVNARVHQRLEKATLTDELSGIPNRRAVMERLVEELVRAARHHDPVAVLMVDIDDFKAINDSFGHAVGDRVIGAVARCLQHETRAYDMAGRIGGEEFLVIAPRTDRDDAKRLAERIRHSIRDSQIESVEGSPIEVTVSVGLAISAPGGERPDEVLSHADEALYQSKANGKDRVSAWESLA